MILTPSHSFLSSMEGGSCIHTSCNYYIMKLSPIHWYFLQNEKKIIKANKAVASFLKISVQVIIYTMLNLKLERRFTTLSFADILLDLLQLVSGFQCFVPIRRSDVMYSYRSSVVVSTSWLLQRFLSGVFVWNVKVAMRINCWF